MWASTFNVTCMSIAHPAHTLLLEVWSASTPTVAQNTNPGERTLYVNQTSSLAVGQWVRIWQEDPGDGSLMRMLHGGGSLWVPPGLYGA